MIKLFFIIKVKLQELVGHHALQKYCVIESLVPFISDSSRMEKCTKKLICKGKGNNCSIPVGVFVLRTSWSWRSRLYCSKMQLHCTFRSCALSRPLSQMCSRTSWNNCSTTCVSELRGAHVVSFSYNSYV